MLSGGSVSPWRSGVEEGRSPLGRFRKPEPCFPRTYATWDAKKDENRFGSVKFRLMRNCLCVAELAVLLSARVASADPTVVISEFMAINNSTLTDEDGTYLDWIELYNSSTNTVNLGGWYLADKATNLTHWQFPSTNLGPSKFLVVFASNKDRRVAGTPLHTNFKLSGSGEYHQEL